MMYVLPAIWLLSLGIMFMRFIHAGLRSEMGLPATKCSTGRELTRFICA